MSRTTPVRLRRRSVRTVPAVLVAVVVLLVGAALVWFAVADLSQGRWPGFLAGLHRWASALTWNADDAVGISAAALVVGLVLLLAAVLPGRVNAVRLAVEPGAAIESQEFVMTRRSVARLATAYAIQLDGVDGVTATVTGRRVALAVTSPSLERSAVSGRITERVRTALQAAGLDPLPTITTTVRTRSL